MQVFTLQVEQLPDNDYQVTLYQVPYHLKGQMPQLPVKIETLTGWRLQAVRPVLLEELRKNGYDPSTLKAGRRAPYNIKEISGIKIGLIFLAVKPLQKIQRVEEIYLGISRMSDEEAYYWFAKCRNGERHRALRALRILLSEEEN
ncbi:hypothetical protein [Desulforamulus putei]|uniref:DUF7680 family protein n=1 Tax=Desulforamulus putei TaxID=74701 RepID=UPI002FDE12E4